MAATLRNVNPDFVPELRRSKQPLPMWVRITGFFVGMITAGGVTAGGALSYVGPIALKAAGGALEREVGPKVEGISNQMAALAKVVEGQRNDTKLAFEKADKARDAQGRLLKDILRRVSAKGPRTPETRESER